LFERLEREQAQIIVPSIVVSEYLTKINPNLHQAVLAEMSSRFLISSFDVRCASIAASLYTRGSEGRVRGQANTRNTLKADCLIVASAKAANATAFYTADAGCRNIAKLRMPAHDLPEMSESIFDQ